MLHDLFFIFFCPLVVKTQKSLYLQIKLRAFRISNILLENDPILSRQGNLTSIQNPSRPERYKQLPLGLIIRCIERIQI